MRAEIVGVGTELLLGQIANTNARWMSERLAAVGVDVLYHQVVGDNAERIETTLRLALSRTDVVLVTGGLGPTRDDITRDVLATVLGVGMVRHAEIERYLRKRFAGSGAQMPASNLRQADVPEGCRFVMPERGTAPGLAARIDGARIYAVPGVPAEMREMMESTILPELAALTGETIVSRTIRCTGIGESRIGEILDDLFGGSENPSVAYLASLGEVKIRLTAKAAGDEKAASMIAPLLKEIARRLGDVVFTTEDESLEQVVARLAVSAGTTIACAESLTGGGVAERLTFVEGASAFFAGSAVVYQPGAKRDVLGVRQETIDGPGVVSRECALEMAAGARRVFDADLAVSLTGAAGPEPHDGAAPGTVWLGLDAEGVSHARSLRLTGERDQVRRWSQQAGLDLLRRHLEGRRLPGAEPPF